MADKKKETKKVQASTTPVELRYRLKAYYENTVVPELMKQFGYKNVNEVPKLDKIVLNMGLGSDKDNDKNFQQAVGELQTIAGQKPVVTVSKNSIANFKVREGMKVGCKVTLRRGKMYDFLDKLISIVLPRVRDFKGVPTKSFDGRGNYSMGVKEQLIFPEIVYDQVEKTRGMDICIVTTAKTDEEGRALLQLMGMPFVRQ